MKVSNFCRPIPGRWLLPGLLRLRCFCAAAVAGLGGGAGDGWRRGSGPSRGAAEAALVCPFW